MSNNHSNTGQDRKLISLEQGYEVRGWPRSRGCTKRQQRAAPKAVGHSAAAMRQYLSRK